MPRDFKQAVAFSHDLLREHVPSGGIAVDATAGNGYDTALLAELVGPQGQVYAFDIQRQALERTAERLEKLGFRDRVTLIEDGHQFLQRYVTCGIDAAIFNLGYLPGGDKTIITRPDTTLQALRSAVAQLNQGGLVVLVIYTGHSGGRQELAAILDFVKELDGRTFNVLQYRFLNQPGQPPQVIAIKKRKQIGS